MLNFTLRESDPNELGAYVLVVSGKEGIRMNIYLWTGDVARLEEAMRKAGF